MTHRGLYSDAGGAVKSHVCNCIGCCETCGQCRTAPWHAQSCGAVAGARRLMRAAIPDAAA